MLSMVATPQSKNRKVSQMEYQLLLSRIKVNLPGLEKVKLASKDNPKKAVQELLNYYKSRKNVKHLIDREKRLEAKGVPIKKRSLTMADNALKHIFIGQPAYAPYFCGKDINWRKGPPKVKDREWVWQLNRLSFWGHMGKAYWQTGNEKYVKEWVYQLMDWTKKNPCIPKDKVVWRTIEAGIRGNSFVSFFQYFIDSPTFTSDVLVVFLNSCFDHSSYLMKHFAHKGNWLLMEAEGIASISLIFPEFKDSNKWFKEAANRFNKQIKKQVFSDGFHNELSFSYHKGCINWFSRTLHLARLNGKGNVFSKSYQDTVENMAAVFMKLGFPDGTIGAFGDSWMGSSGSTFRLLSKWAIEFNRKDFLYLATQGKEGVIPKSRFYALKKSGFYSMRSDWTDQSIFLLLKCGPNGGWHCQPDNGTFEISAGGRRFMPDSGCFIYSGDPKSRAWFRKSAHHQTLTLNGKNIAYRPKNLLWDPHDDLVTLVVENGSYKNLIHRRTIFFINNNIFILVDEATGPAVGNVDLHFQLLPSEIDFNEKELKVSTKLKEGWNISVKSVNQNGMILEKEKGQVSFKYTKKEPRPAFRYRIKKTTPKGVRFVTVLVPFQNKEPKVKLTFDHEQKIRGKAFKLKVTIDGVEKEVGYQLKDLKK